MPVHHVFPYDPGHLGLTVPQWREGQRARWPLAAVCRSELAGETTIHVLGGRPWSPEQVPAQGPLRLVVHPTLYSNARWHHWGDDWSLSLARALSRMGPEDIVVVHLEGYAAARLSLRYSSGARRVVVLHGRGTGGLEDHAAADLSVVLHDWTRSRLEQMGVDPERLVSVVPSIDRALFHPPVADRTNTVGFVGRFEESKGFFELPALLRSLRDLGLTLECIGSAPSAHEFARAEDALRGIPSRILGELQPSEVAGFMQRWQALLMPSRSEGMPLTALEAVSSELPVVAVTGVLPRFLSERPGVYTGERKELEQTVRLALLSHDRPVGDGVPDHQEGGRTWDQIYRALHKPVPSARPSAKPLLGRLRRLRMKA